MIEVFHRDLKQTCGVERCQARSATSQRNHIGFAIRAFVRLERFFFKTIALLHLLILAGTFIKNMYYIYSNSAENKHNVLLKISWFILSSATVATIFITTVGWWARLSPQVWLAVGVIETGIIVSVTSNLLRISAIIVTTLMVMNTFLIGYQLFQF